MSPSSISHTVANVDIFLFFTWLVGLYNLTEPPVYTGASRAEPFTPSNLSLFPIDLAILYRYPRLH